MLESATQHVSQTGQGRAPARGDSTVEGMSEIFVASGEMIAYRLFDVAYEVNLDRAEAVLEQHHGAGGVRKQLNATPPKAVAYDVAPLVLTRDPVPLVLRGETIAATATVRLYDFGVLSLALSIAVGDLSWPEFVQGLNAFDERVGPGPGDSLWTELADRIRVELRDALVRPAKSTLEEDYIIALVRSFDRHMVAAEVQEHLDLVPLLSGEQRPLSATEQHEVLRNRFSYYTDDLVVLTWDRAFIFEPRPDSDVIDVLEVANAQLLEMRYYDELLNDELPRMYDHVETAQRASRFISSHRYAGLARRLYTLVAEVTELTEKVDNALQVTEDVYLARVYAAALEVLRVRPVRIAVDRKLAIIRDTYTALYDEASGARNTLLEIAIVVLIIVEIVVAIWR
jgi:hypothetical protein